MDQENGNGSATMGAARGEFAGIADEAAQRARSFVEEGKETAAQQIGAIATAIRGAAREFERQVPQSAGLIRSAATTLEGGAERLRQRSVDEWLHSAGEFARNEPMALFGGALLAGFALSRFFTSSRPPAPGNNQS